MGMSVEARIRDILLHILDIREEDVVPTANFSDDLKATSLDLVEIFTAIQNTFAITLDEAQVAVVKTVQDAVDLVKAALERRGAGP
jgi:acyl carrier protein